MPQIWPVNKGGEGYRRLFSFQADSVMMLASYKSCFLYNTDILILTGISTASELAKEKGSMIHLSQTCRTWRDEAQHSQVLGCDRTPSGETLIRSGPGTRGDAPALSELIP
jgi:hypothetical protein